MKGCVVVLLALIMGMFGLISCSRMLNANTNNNNKKLMSNKNVIVETGDDDNRRPIHESRTRSKRRLQDVEKMMREDELMSYLICDMCVSNVCEPKYCKYCSQCVNNFNGKSFCL